MNFLNNMGSSLSTFFGSLLKPQNQSILNPTQNGLPSQTQNNVQQSTTPQGNPTASMQNTQPSSSQPYVNSVQPANPSYSPSLFQNTQGIKTTNPNTQYNQQLASGLPFQSVPGQSTQNQYQNTLPNQSQSSQPTQGGFQLPQSLQQTGLTAQQLGLAPTQASQDLMGLLAGTGVNGDNGVLSSLTALKNQLAQANAPTEQQAAVQAQILQAQGQLAGQGLAGDPTQNAYMQSILHPELKNTGTLTQSSAENMTQQQGLPIQAALTQLLLQKSALGTMQQQQVAGLGAQIQSQQNTVDLAQQLAALRNQYQTLPDSVRSAILTRNLAPEITPHFENVNGQIEQINTNQMGQVTSKTDQGAAPQYYNPFGGAPIPAATSGGGISVAPFNPQSALDVEAQSYMQTGQATTAMNRNPNLDNAVKQRANQLAGGTFNAAIAQGGAASQKDLIDQKANVVAAFGAADKNFPLLLATMKKGNINNLNAPVLNQLQQSFNNKFIGSGDMASFNALVTSLQTEYTRILARGGTVTDKTRGEAQDLVSGKISYNSLKSLYQTLTQEKNNVISGYDDAIKSSGSQSNFGSQGQNDPMSIR